MVEYNANYKVGPGDYLMEVLKSNEISKEYLAYLSGITINEIDNILDNKVGISLDFAEKLEQIFKIDRVIWLNISKRYFGV